MSISSLKLISLELVGCKRLTLTGNRIKLSPISALQLILGSNGCGKSSLMAEISPLPAISSNYEKNGSKTTEWWCDGSKYLIISTFTHGSQKHSFFKDDFSIDLNPGGTLTVQKQLVLEHFGIDFEIQNLLLGNEVFTRMSPTRRREWFTRMGSNNYEYSLKVFQKLKKKHRDVVGALDITKYTLVDEVAKRLKPEEVDQLRSSIINGKNQLSIAIRNMSNERLNYAQSTQTFENVRSRFLSSIRQLQSYSGRAHTWVFGKDKEVVEDVITQFTIEMKSITNAIHRQSEEYLKIEQRINEMRSMGLENQTELKNKLDEANKSIEDIKSKMIYYDILESMMQLNGVNVESAIESVSPYLRELSATLPANTDRKLSRKNKELLEVEQLEIKSKLTKLNIELAKVELIIKEHIHLRDHAQTECPKCKHIFSKGFSQETLTQSETLAGKITDEITSLQKSMESLSARIAENESYGQSMAIFSRCMSVDYIRPIRDHITSEYLFNNPIGISAFLDRLQIDLFQFIAVQDISKRKECLQTYSQNESKFEERSASQLKDQLNKLMIEINELSKKRHYAESKIVTYSKMKDCISEMEALNIASIKLEEEMNLAFRNMIVSGIDDCYSKYISELESALATQESTLRAIDIREGYIVELEKEIIKLTQHEKAYAVLISALSPTDGIIAESLHAFMSVYIQQMNQFIEGIWSYPLEIKFSEIKDDENVELDYKFPFTINNKITRSDVSVGSRAMEEIFNLAFRMIASQHLGLGHCPLFLDEFASSFDKEHRVTATQVVSALMNQNVFSQLFMVSHYEDGYSPLVDADICVLSESNIVVPVSDKINHHVIIE